MFLTIVDTTQIQRYIFGSNRLRENIGASHLVAQATGPWALAAVRQAAPNNNIVSVTKGELDSHRMITADNEQDAEVMYVGGGNAVVIFRQWDQVTNFTERLSRWSLEDAPGLQLIIASHEFHWVEESLVGAMEQALKKLSEAKRVPRSSVPLLGLGVSMKCQSTALPVVEMVRIAEGEDPVSAETVAKLKVVGAAKARLKAVIGSLEELPYEYPDELDYLGRSIGEQSHIAVVHADGDGMGKRLQSLGGKYSQPDEKNDYSAANRGYVNALRNFSKAVNDAAQAALQTTLKRLIDAIEGDPDSAASRMIPHNPARTAGVDWIAPVSLKEVENDGDEIQYWYLPFRPVVFGGDDVTFVCDGRLGIGLANLYIQEFTKETRNRSNECVGMMTASAGVSIVKTHYPFSRAYQLAEELIGAAKRYRREITSKKNDWNGACLDWHFALSGLSGRLANIREREYEAGKLLLRPVTLEGNPMETHRSWQVVARSLNEFQTSDQWADKRNKMKTLRERLREGEGAVQEFLSLHEPRKLPGIELPLTAGYQERGWEAGRCLYFDALEMADWHIPLPDIEPQEDTQNG